MYNKHEKKYIFYFDLDNIICKTNSSNYKNSTPRKKSMKLVNYLFENGHIIKIFAAWYMSSNKENVKIVKKKGYKFINGQLKKWGLKYHKLIMGKPSYDIFVDDKAYGYKNNWIIHIKKKNLK